MFKIFGDNFKELFLKFFFQSYLLIERSLRIRSNNSLTMREMLLLGMVERLKKTNNHTVMNIAKYLQVSPPIISNSVKSLIRKNYLTKVLNPDDNRIYFLELTEKGILSNQNSLNFSEKMMKKGMGKISLFDIRSLLKSFKAIESVIDEENQALDLEEQKKPKKL
jgi:DNA-binding MarR family transcriptional regulator